MINISLLILDVCKKLNIDYKSEYTENIEQYERDIQSLTNIYYRLKQSINELSEIETRYEDLNGLSNLLKDDIKSLDTIDHHLLFEVQKITKKKSSKKPA